PTLTRPPPLRLGRGPQFELSRCRAAGEESDEGRAEKVRGPVSMPDLSFAFAQSLSGLTAAMFLFLIAAGLSLIFGVLRVLNFAHGTFYMLGAYLAFQAMQIGRAHV